MIPYCITMIEDEDDCAFMTRIFQQYQRLMYQQICRYLHNRWDVEDVMQDVLEKLIIKVKVLRGLNRNQQIYYIIVACRHRTWNHLRDQSRHPIVELDEMFDAKSESGDRDAVESRLIKESERACFLKVWETLDSKSRYILEAHYILEESNETIAKELGVKPQSVRMALSRARKTARRKMKKLLEEER